MLDFARARFALSKPDKTTGKTRLQVLRDIERQTGRVAPELAALPEVPQATAHIWGWFADLSRARLAAYAMEPISWADIRGYFDLMRIRPQPWEVDTLRQIDDAFLESHRSEATSVVTGAQALKSRMTRRASNDEGG